jgi:large subunit ribosomal protein L6
MSRIGKQPIIIPDGVKVEIKDKMIKVTGPKGTLEKDIPSSINVKEENKNIIVERKNEERETRAFHGLTRSLINNMVLGVSQGFTKELDVIGVGFKAQVKGKNILSLYLGHSHSVEYFIPDAIEAKVEARKGASKIKLESYNKQLLGEVAAQIRGLRPPEPYKGKGIRYSDEVVKKKVGKAVVGK